MRIWFNHWFSAVYHTILMIKEGGEACVIGSNENEYAVYKTVCDEFYVEPSGLNETEYVEYCLAFCKEHRVDVFAPRRNLAAIVQANARFEALGVKLFANTDGGLACILDDKALTYEYASRILPTVVPAYRVAHSFEEFAAAYAELKSLGGRVCYKLTIDEGARSFRVIDVPEKVNALYEKPGFKVTEEMAFARMQNYSFDVPVLLMPFLSGLEISVDCLKGKDGDLIIPRYKMNKRYSELKYDEEIMGYCKTLLSAMGAEMPVNIQFKMHEGKAYLLEINPRISGGIQLSCKGAGVNLPLIALNKLLGKEYSCLIPLQEAKVVHVETPVCVD